MADSSAFVYSASRDAHRQITQLSDFVSPTIVAMWNLRWQVLGYLQVKPNASQPDLTARFSLGSGMHGNELRRACAQNSWEQQQERFASILLTNTIAIYEDFAEQLAAVTMAGEARRRAYKDLQYPARDGKGYPRAYSVFGQPVSELSGVFTKPSRWSSPANLQALMYCFRYFKEVRNVQSHNGGRATPELMDAYSDFSPVANAAALGVKESPSHEIPALNQPVGLHLRGVYGFSDVVLRIIATHDAQLADRRSALVDIEKHLGRISGPARAHVEVGIQRKRIAGLLRGDGLPEATLTPAFLKYLKKVDRIPTYWED